STLSDSLDAEAGIGRTRFHVREADHGDLGGGRHGVVGEGRGERLPLAVERNLVEKARPDALHDYAKYLAVHHHRIDAGTAIVDRNIIEDFDQPRFRVDGDSRSVRGTGERPLVAIRWIACGDLHAVPDNVV